MTLSTEDKKIINNFFNNKSLSNTFIKLYDYQVSICDDVEFVLRDKIIGFGRPGEHLRCYCSNTPSGFIIKIKIFEEPVFFEKEKLDDYKLKITVNNLSFTLNPEKYTLLKNEPAPKTKKKSRKSQEKKDPVLAKLKNRNRAKKFTLTEFNDLADWTYCDSFNEDGYIYILPNGNKIECDSKSEVTLLDYLTKHKIAQAIGGQNLLIEYESAFRSGLSYYPDIVILTKDNHIAVIEVKPVTAMSNHRNMEKYEALKEYCEENQYEYMMIDPDHDYMTYDDLLKLRIPSSITERINSYLDGILGGRNSCLLEKDDVNFLYDEFSDEYKKGEFELYLHALVIQNGWYNKFTHGFMVYQRPTRK